MSSLSPSASERADSVYLSYDRPDSGALPSSDSPTPFSSLSVRNNRSRDPVSSYYPPESRLPSLVPPPSPGLSIAPPSPGLSLTPSSSFPTSPTGSGERERQPVATPTTSSRQKIQNASGYRPTSGWSARRRFLDDDEEEDGGQVLIPPVPPSPAAFEKREEPPAAPPAAVRSRSTDRNARRPKHAPPVDMDANAHRPEPRRRPTNPPTNAAEALAMGALDSSSGREQPRRRPTNPPGPEALARQPSSSVGHGAAPPSYHSHDDHQQGRRPPMPEPSHSYPPPPSPSFPAPPSPSFAPPRSPYSPSAGSPFLGALSPGPPAYHQWGTSAPPSPIVPAYSSPRLVEGDLKAAGGHEEAEGLGMMAEAESKDVFFKRLSLAAHERELAARPGNRAPQQSEWLRKQKSGRGCMKFVITLVVLLILGGIGVGVAWHFSHPSSGDDQPHTPSWASPLVGQGNSSQTDSGTSPTSRLLRMALHRRKASMLWEGH